MKLVYFNAKGLAETSRLLLAIVRVSYEDYRYPLEVVDMKSFNMVKKEFDEDKSNGKLVGSLNKVPYLEVEGQVIPQSKAIERYISKSYNLMGSNLLEEARIDAIGECIRDIKDAYQKVRRIENPDEKVKGLEEWFSETLPTRMELLEKVLDEEFAVGSSLSLADVQLFSFITQFFDNKEGASNAINNCPGIRNSVDKVANLEEVKEWINTRPDTVF